MSHHFPSSVIAVKPSPMQHPLAFALSLLVVCSAPLVASGCLLRLLSLMVVWGKVAGEKASGLALISVE
ncbi:hypothetical protein NL676_020990 [Syzygium grande]|nr:hypothetical protein NL676_020990 [Syzygium grande]